MKNELDRREFLKRISAGAAVVSLPVLASCTASKQAVQPVKTPLAPRGAPVTSTYFDQFGVSPELILKALERALVRGGDFSEVFLQHKINHWITMEDGEINRAYMDVALGAGIRVLKGDATGFAYCEELTEKALLATAETAAAVADSKPAVTSAPLMAMEVKNHYQVEAPWSEVGFDKRLPVIERANRQVRARDKRIIKVTVSMSDETSRILVANSEGLVAEDDQPMGLLSISCVARSNGKTETGYQGRAARDGLAYFSHPVIDQVAGEAADYTTMLFGAVPPPVGELPVVLAPGVSGILLHEAMGHGFEADFNRKGISIFADRIGQRIAPDHVTIVDDGTNERLRGSINIDDEGTPGQRTVLVEKGILRSYLHDRISARHYRIPSTGSGRRQSFRYPAVPRMRNTYMVNGPHKAEEVIRSVKKGLYAEVFSNGQVQIGAGDFTFFLKHGRLIEDGKLTKVVKDANLIGSGPKVLEKIDMVADDMEMFSGAGWCGKDRQRVAVGFGLPTLRAGGISIGGRTS